MFKFLAPLALFMLCATGGALALSEQARRAILPVHEALEHVRDQQARQVPARDDRTRLTRLGALDQAPRKVLTGIDLSKLPAGERMPASQAMWHEIDTQDAANQAALVALMPASGWFTRDRYGPSASAAAWIVVQHATNNPALMRAALARMKPAVQAHLADPGDYGMLFDRVAMLSGRPQTYGTQFTCVDHRWHVYALRDPAHVDQRRRALGLPEPQEQEAARMAGYPPCFVAP